MVSYSFLIGGDKATIEKFKKYSKIIGIVFVVLGIISLLFPIAASLATAIYLGWIFLVSSFLTFWNVWNNNKKDWIGWLKAFIFLVVGALIVINPLPGVAALGIIFAVYFFMDSFASIAMAFDLKPNKGWVLSLINGILSFIIGFYLIIGWPFNSIWMVGLLVGISLFFDGILLLTLAKEVESVENKVDSTQEESK